MQVELEAKFLGVDPAAIRLRLQSLAAELVHPEHLMKRRPYDFADGRLRSKGGWVRVRAEAGTVTLSYKQLNNRTLTGTHELTLEVNDFDKACELVEAIGLEATSYQETKREAWQFDGCEVTIDTWPWIPTFVEIEGPTEAKVKAVAQALGFDWAEALHGSVEIAYQHYYAVTEEEIWQWKEITFGPVPSWLERKRKNA